MSLPFNEIVTDLFALAEAPLPLQTKKGCQMVLFGCRIMGVILTIKKLRLIDTFLLDLFIFYFVHKNEEF